VNGVIYRKKVREVILASARGGRDAVILGGDFNGHTVNMDCSVRPPPDDSCYRFFPPPHCENVDVAGAARLLDEWWPSIDGAAFSQPAGDLPGFYSDVDRPWVDGPAAAIAEHAPVMYELSDPTPEEPTGCSRARGRVRAIPYEMARQRERLRGLTPRDPDYWDVRKDVEREIARLTREREKHRSWAARAGCDPL
jgi:hypothetical protein